MNQTREATERDIPALIQLQKELIAFERQFDIGIRDDALYYPADELRGLIHHAHGNVIVIETGDGLVACGLGKIVPGAGWDAYDKKGYIGMVYVSPNQRGRGLGRRVIDALLSWFASQNIKDVHLNVYPDNAAAIALYKSYGFTPHLAYYRKLDRARDAFD